MGLPTSLAPEPLIVVIVDGDFEMSLKTKLKKRKPEQIDLVFCMDRPLAKELDRSRERDRADGNAYSGGKSEKTRELEKAVQAASVTIRIIGLPWGDYNQLLEEHPARDGVNELMNTVTFFPAAAKATAVEVTAKGTMPIPDEDWDEFVDGLSDGEFDRLVGAVVQVNRSQLTVDIAPLV